MTHVLVERPARRRSARTWVPLALILSTLENGQAVRITLGHRRPVSAAAAIYQAVRRAGYRARIVVEPDALVCWAERR